MTFPWLKRYMPRSIFWRAALILTVPLILLQIVVLVVFFQRHFEDVTFQMTQSIIRELRLVQQVTESAQTQEEAQAQMAPILPTLGLSIAFVSPEDVPDGNRRRWYDLSGLTVISTLKARLPETLAVSLWEGRLVTAFIDTRFGPARVIFARRNVSATAPHQLLVIMIGFGALLMAVAFVYLRNQLRPVVRLADAATAFGRGRTVPFEPSGAMEVRVAGNAFLDMRARIERQMEQRTLMLSGISHDLRTPLTRMKLGLSMMDADDTDPMLRDVNEMERLVDSFLEFSKGAMSGEPEAVDPIAFVDGIVADARRSGQPVSLAKTEGSGAAMLRSMAMRRAVENLIGNAVRYGSHAELEVRLTDGTLRIRVEDDGPGIPPDQQAQAVKPFARLDPARNQNKGSGVGLGLAIASDVAQAHGGMLRLGDSARLGGLCADIVIAR
ncbi:MAG: two-component sensor histidine kinase [Rhodobacteraceae bacterium]|nr:two-component sensor histidine kinase [Paracoccaceae bacterium]